MYVTVEEIKKQTNVDFNDDDLYIAGLIDVAEISVANYINSPLSEHVVLGVLASPIKQAILLVAANLYENREPVSYGQAAVVPFTFNYLLMPYVRLT